MISSFMSNQDIHVYLETGREVERLGEGELLNGKVILNSRPEIQGILEVLVDSEEARKIHPGIGVRDNWKRGKSEGKIHVFLTQRFYSYLAEEGSTGTRYGFGGSKISLYDCSTDQSFKRCANIVRGSYEDYKDKRPTQKHLF